MKIRKFDSYDEYETYYENTESDKRYEVVDIVRFENCVCADLITDCKSVKTALNRFFKTVKEDEMFADWESEIRESVENGYYKVNEYRDSGFCWEVENHGDSYYIMIKMNNGYINNVYAN